MKFEVTWLEEKTGIVEAGDIQTVAQSVRHHISLLDKPKSAKLLSIYRVDPPLAPIASVT